MAVAPGPLSPSTLSQQFSGLDGDGTLLAETIAHVNWAQGKRRLTVVSMGTSFPGRGDGASLRGEMSPPSFLNLRP